MISPTPRAIAIMLAGLPVMIAVAIVAPRYWVVSAGWITGLLGAMLCDFALAARRRQLEVQTDAPALLYSGSEDDCEITLKFGRGALPREMKAHLETNAYLAPMNDKSLQGWPGRTHKLTYTLRPLRRGPARLETLWLDWLGPLKLVRLHHRERLDRELPVTPNTRWIKDEAVRLYTRDADFGIKAQIERGDGSEFDALREFSSGMDRRAIDWKHSARHRMLFAKEFRTERNHNILFCFDTGRLMSEPLNGVPKLDRAINAGLLLAYVSLRAGDRTALFGFDARPGLSTHLRGGTGAFPHLQRQAARLDYSTEDANYTLALTTLAQKLERRSLIILFTDFVDTISAELMLENLQRLTRRHLVVFASFEDAAMSAMVDAEPQSSRDVTRAVIADTLLQERELVFRRLQRLGVQIIETTPEKFGSELVSRYLDIKRRELL